MQQKCQRRSCGRMFENKLKQAICSTCRARGHKLPEGHRTKIKLGAVDLAMLKLSERD